MLRRRLFDWAKLPTSCSISAQQCLTVCDDALTLGAKCGLDTCLTGCTGAFSLSVQEQVLFLQQNQIVLASMLHA